MRLSQLALLTAAVVSAAPAALAGPILDGSFSTIATSGGFETNNGFVNITGTTVTGSFDLATVAGAFTPGGYPAGSYFLQPGSATLSFDIQAINQVVTFGSASQTGYGYLQLTDNGITQQLLIDPDTNPHSNTEIAFTGPEGSLFGNIDDPRSIHAGIGVSLVSPIFLGVFQEGGAFLDPTSLTFGTTPVSEPPSLALLGLPVFGLLARCLPLKRHALAQNCRAVAERKVHQTDVRIR